MPNYTLKIIVEGEDRASGPLKSVGSALGDIGKIAAGVSLGNMLSQGVGALAGMAKGALDSYAAYEQLGKSINSLTAKEALLTGQASTLQQAMGQTAGKSKELLDWIQRLAIESPFRQEDVAGAFRLSLAFGFSTKEAQRLTTAMVDFTTATGASGETIERVSRALGQIKTRGKLSMEELNQLAEGGVDALRILGDATGKTGKDLMDSITKGQIDANFAIQAILKDMEKMYAGAGKSAATSMSGLLSTLSEIKDTVGRDLLGGVFQSFQAPLAGLTTILTAPEFRAGVQQWGATLGQFSSDQIQGAADAMERIDKAITPLIDAKAPLWLTGLQALAAAGGSEFGITITPKVTKVVTPDGGLTFEVTPWAATVTNKEGGLLGVDVVAGRITADANTKDDLPPVILTANWKEGTIGSAIAAFQAKTQEEQNKILLNAGWKGTAFTTLQTLIDATQLWAKVNPVFVLAKTATDATLGLWALAQGLFTGKPINVETQAENNSLVALWNTVQQTFANNPVSVAVSVDAVDVETARSIVARNVDMLLSSPATQQGVGFLRSNSVGQSGYTFGPTWNSPATSSTGGPTPKRNRDGNNAAGTDFWKGGWTWVGEEGPELLNLPRGARILSNPDSMRMIGQNAGGTTQLPPGAGPIVALLGSLGLWKSTGAGSQMGPKTADQARGWQDFTQKGVQAMQTAADRTGQAFEDTAKKVNSTFESALQGVPGLFGTSQVTAQDMELSKYGAYKPKADEYLRQLSDEVLNGKDWGSNVDIKDAAKRAGIDPNLPNDIILELVKEAWNNSSLFAEGKNLDLINTDAVKAAIEQQQKEMSGQASLKALFGINDENLQKQSEALGQGLASVFGGASETDAVKGAGTALFAKTMAGFTDPATAAAGVNSMAGSIVDATGTPENQAALYDAGKAGYAAYNRGWTAGANAAPIVPPGGGSGTTPPGGTPPAGNALGTPSWRGGWTVAGEYGPELLNLPGGTSIYDAPTTQRMRRGGGRPLVVNQTFVVNDKLMAEQAAQRAVQLIKRGGR